MKAKDKKEDQNDAKPAESVAGGAAPEASPLNVFAEGVQNCAGAVEPGDAAGTAGAPAPVDMVPAAQFDELNDRYLRLRADFDNFRKRIVREREETIKRANEDLVLELLPVIDHLELALKSASGAEVEGQAKAIADGFRMVADQLVAALKKFGLEPIEAEGKPFDYNVHESISQAPSAEHPEGTVMQQTRKGYMLGDRLLKAAQVIVSSGPAKNGDDAGAGE